MYVTKNFNGKMLKGTVREKDEFFYMVDWEDGAFGLLKIEDENKWYKLHPACKIIASNNERIFEGMFEDCREYCRKKWNCAGHSPDFLIRNGYTDVLFLNMIVAQIVSE